MPTKTKLLDLNEVADIVIKLAMEKFEKAMKKVDNPPLTWDELREMEGKPIWIEFTYHNPEEIYKYWTIVKYFDNDEGGAKMITGTGVYYKCAIDIDWQAYRKDRK